MADTFRAPLFASMREIAPVLAVTTILLPSLLVTVLAANMTPLPFNTAKALQLQVHAPPKRPIINADTTRGTPKPLRADNQAPFFVPAHFAPSATRVKNWLPAGTSLSSSVWLIPTGPLPLPPGGATPTSLYRFFWQPPDTGTATPKPLIADSAAPIALPILSAPEIVRSVTDTSRSAPVWLIPTGPPPLPPGGATPTSLYRFFWQPPDTTADTPKTLTADATTPFAVLQQPVLDRVRPVADTSQDTPVVLFPITILPLPPGASVWAAAPARLWLPDDTSASTPKTAIADAQFPIRNLQHTQPDRRRPVADTSQSAYAAARPVVVLPLPPGQAAYWVSHRFRWTLPDSSTSSSLALTAPIVATATLAAYQRPAAPSARPSSTSSSRPGSPNTRRG